MVKEHARGTMQLGNDDTLGAVDDKGAILRHERNFTHVDVLLLDVLDGLGGGLLVINDQAYLDAQGAGVGRATEHTLIDVKYRLAQVVPDVLEGSVAAVTGDGKYRFKGRVQPVVAALVCRHPILGKLAVGIQLDRQQVRDVHYLCQRTEIFADAFLLSV